MKKEDIVKQLKVNSLRVTAKNLRCSYTTLRYWIRKHKLIIPPLHGCCNQCGSEFVKRKAGPTKKLCDKCKNNFRGMGYSKYGLNELQKRIRRKSYIIEKMGGKCSKCGYDKNVAALDLHHTNPKEKDFSLNSGKLSKLNFSEIENELKKCVVLCGNCHSEHHYPSYSNWKALKLFW